MSKAVMVVAALAACASPLARAPSLPVPAPAPVPVPVSAPVDPDPPIGDGVTVLANGVHVRVMSDYGRQGSHVALVIEAGMLDEKDGERGVAAWAARAAAPKARVVVGAETTVIELSGAPVDKLVDDARAMVTAAMDDAVVEGARKSSASKPDDVEVAVRSGTQLAVGADDVATMPVERARAFRDRLWVAPRISIIVESSEGISKVQPQATAAFATLPAGAAGTRVDVAAAIEPRGARDTRILPSDDGKASLDYIFLVPRRPIVRASDLRERLAEEIAIDAVFDHVHAAVLAYGFVDLTKDVRALGPHLDEVHLGVTGDVSLAWLARITAPAFAEATRGLGADERTARIADMAQRTAYEARPREEAPQHGAMYGTIRPSHVFVGDLENGDTVASWDRHVELRGREAPRVTADQVATYVPYFARGRAAIVGRARNGDKVTPAALRAALEAGQPRDVTIDSAYVATPPPDGEITGEKVDAGKTTWTLANGATVIVDPEVARNREVTLEAWSPGGALAMSDALLDAAFAIPAVAEVGGAGQLDASARASIEHGHRVHVELVVGANRHGLRAVAPDATEVARMLAETHALLAAPVRDDEAAAAALRARATDGEYHDTMRLPARLAAELDVLPVTTHAPGDVWDAMRARFGHARGFTFVLHGVDAAKVKADVLRYLASLPAGTADRAQKVVMPQGRVGARLVGIECGRQLRWVGVPAAGVNDGLDDLVIAEAVIALDDGGASGWWIETGTAERAFRMEAGDEWPCEVTDARPWSERSLRARLARIAKGEATTEEVDSVRDHAMRHAGTGEWEKYKTLSAERIARATTRFLPGDNVVVVTMVPGKDKPIR